MVMPTFSDRLTRRYALWWTAPRDWRDPRTYVERVHRWRERHALRDRKLSDAEWRCCRFWQRTLLHKWNSRELAARHGCRIPRLLWYGADPSRELFESLPEDFVVRPIAAHSRQGVYVVAGGTELLTGQKMSRVELQARVRVTQPRGRLQRRLPLLVEERIAGERGDDLPLEIKILVFGREVFSVLTLERFGAKLGTQRYYTPAFEPFAGVINVALPQSPLREAPRGLARLIELSSRLGAALGTFMRIDWFAGPDGEEGVFNEFSSMPAAGSYTPYGDQILGRAWQDFCPGAV